MKLTMKVIKRRTCVLPTLSSDSPCFSSTERNMIVLSRDALLFRMHPRLKRVLKPWLIALWILFWLWGILPACSIQGPTWGGVKAEIKNAYPLVPQLPVDELHDRLVRGDTIILVDAREPKEYEVSHLKGASQASRLRTAAALIGRLDLSMPIVVYCSVGIRSSALAERLIGAGFTNTANLEGSIFEWGNSGYPVYRGTQPVREIHPYDQEWATLLNAELRFKGQGGGE